MSKFENAINGNYEFDLNRFINMGWETFKQEAGTFIGFALVYFVIQVVMSVIPLVSLGTSFVTTTIMGGAFIFIRNMKTKQHNFSNFFDGFKVFGQIALYLLVFGLFLLPIIAIVIFAIFTTGAIDHYGSPEMFTGNIIGLILLVVVLVLLIYIFYSMALPLIVDAKLDFWQAMETSRKTVMNKFGSFLGLAVVMFLISLLGLLLCGVGVLASFPLVLCIQFHAYDQIFKPGNDYGLDGEIGSFGTTSPDVNTESEDKPI